MENAEKTIRRHLAGLGTSHPQVAAKTIRK